MYLASQWAQITGRDLHILTVDHRLRPEAAEEAAYVKQLAVQLGHRHTSLHWDRPRAGQQAARDARLRLMCAHLQRQGIGVLLMGHTLDDVLETALIRRRRGVRGWAVAGPASVAPAPVWPEGRQLALIRPLVGILRADLRSYLQRRRVGWRDDPSNQNTKYERVRIRSALQRHPKMVAKILPHVRHLQAARRQADLALADDIQAHLSVYASGLVLLNHSAPEQRLLSCAVRYAGGHDLPPRAAALERLQNAVLSPGERRVLGGAWFQKAGQGYLIGRDPAVWPQSPCDGLWDGRYIADPQGTFPSGGAIPFMLRTTAPPGPAWREIISERIAFEALCYRAASAQCDMSQTVSQSAD